VVEYVDPARLHAPCMQLLAGAGVVDTFIYFSLKVFDVKNKKSFSISTRAYLPIFDIQR
jgi:hypothetical protein